MVNRQWPIERNDGESEEAFAARLEGHLGRPLSLLERIDVFEERLRTAGRRAIAELHAAGVSAYYKIPGDPRIVRHDADGHRWFVRIIPCGEDEILGETPDD